ncbi:response regulator transcription factor [Pseudomonas chlororaphis subsp. aurantiaca]|uniref:response regulator transcription factor n=1 Tax=Pseudomonas chlororaphis TaxID=587753 RepID=UPI0027DAD641|nr:response regulator transcription factor [Pseudomonas chlororaphis]WMI97632.1 response regulator transcription factor [Pseudomonas chlororaphis subsp. aurantiaca]
MAYRILIVDDHPVVRLAVRVMLTGEGHEIVGEAGNGVEAVSCIRQHNPDLVLLDITMPTLDGIAVIERMKKFELPAKVIMLTSLSAGYYAMRCVRAGASGFISKEEALDVLPGAINKVMEGCVYLPESVSDSSHKSDMSVGEVESIASLSDRELSVLQQLSRGISVKDIANNIMLSSKTVSCYKARLIAKLNVKSVVDLADLARRNKLI